MSLILDAPSMNSSLRKPLSRGEIFALGLAFGAAGVFLWLSPTLSFTFFDFKIYLNTAHGDFAGYYYGYWVLPIFAALAKLPLTISYVLWGSLNIVGIFFAARVFGGKAALALMSYQMFYTLIYGGISGVIVGGLALCWWGLVNRKWGMSGLGIALASAKYQLGIPGIVLLLFMSDIPWKDRLRALVVPVLVWVASLFLYPGWPFEAISNILNAPPNFNGSISLWRWLGPWALLLWIPPLLLRLPTEQRFLALTATTGLALPYFQQSDLLFLMILPIGWVGLLGNLGYLLSVYGWVALQILALLPLVVYCRILLPACGRLISRFLKLRTMNSSA